MLISGEKMDYVNINNLEIFANHGVFPEENFLGQKFLVSAKMGVDIRKAGLSDDLNNTLNYGEICQYITDFMKNNTFKLIETVVERLAEKMLLNFELLKSIELTIKKPWAPIGLPLETASITIKRSWHRAFIALGSNMGDSKAYLDNGLKSLNCDKIKVLKTSEYMVTKAYGYTDQPDFLNACTMVDTLLTPHELLDRLHEIEKEAHRERIIRWGPRTLDLDIIFYDKLIFEDDELVIPHIDMENRDFVLFPMKEIAPNFRHPILNKTMTQLSEQLSDR
ncbi:dihydroneopterin aldolase / 2-amino-4-hydroxy-6-hydroxymethyldihydropteridine diphosphokinase [Acetitomaculum ruminis DSM 5522]|uniref:Bifunctional folate synthesis protein n=2 Tax=Acetitomaculum ruminis TaxID=2382 RepID=A0A1I0XSI3_9FIRM|nr:dihydroneopterin aldolase / 2-amino-4-hydroxy-6-hydroxymethyldihydropteridine diphosphokinase [Acetitomaculum ruminis DSM 5522]